MSVFFDNLDIFWAGLRTTAALTALSFAFALVIGTVLASCRVSPIKPLRIAAMTYVETVRNCPLTVHILLAFFGWPKLGFRYSPFVTAVIVLSYYTGAFVGETIRAGMNTVGRGQLEAARSIGLGFSDTLRLVVLPQAVRTVIAPLGSLLSALVRNSAIAYTISVLDIMGRSDRLITTTAQPLAVLVGAALTYYVLTIPLAFGINAIDRRQRIAR
ncbi:MAG: amino acid ABC transporter permease [Acidimicrobiales bacterium]